MASKIPSYICTAHENSCRCCCYCISNEYIKAELRWWRWEVGQLHNSFEQKHEKWNIAWRSIKWNLCANKSTQILIPFILVHVAMRSISSSPNTITITITIIIISIASSLHGHSHFRAVDFLLAFRVFFHLFTVSIASHIHLSYLFARQADFSIFAQINKRTGKKNREIILLFNSFVSNCTTGKAKLMRAFTMIFAIHAN